jgi:hypothetical protein
MNSMNGFSGLQKQVQSQLDAFTKRATKRPSQEKLSMRRGGEAGDIIPTGHRLGKIGQFDEKQTDLYNRSFENLGPDSYLSRLSMGDQSLFDEMEAPALRQFNQIQGNLASRFSGAGLGARNSTGFQNTSNQYTSNFVQDLQSRRQDLQRQATIDLMGLSRELLNQRPYEKFLTKKQYPQQQPDQSGDLLGGLLNGIGGAGAGYLTGGPTYAVAGGAQGFANGYRGYNGGD